MSRALTAGELKALVRQLVSAIGGVEAAALELCVTHQRVSQLQSPNCSDQMSMLQVVALEAVVGRDIVTGAASRAIVGEMKSSVHEAAVEAVTRTAVALRLVTDMDSDGLRDAAEIQAVQRAARENLQAAQELADGATRLTSGRVA